MDILINPHARERWTPPGWTTHPERPVLILQPLNGVRFLDLIAQGDVIGDDYVRWTGKNCAAIVEAALVDWEVPGGSPFPGAAAAIEQLDAVTLKMAAMHILAESGLGTVTRKNSGSAPASSPAPSSTEPAEAKGVLDF